LNFQDEPAGARRLREDEYVQLLSRYKKPLLRTIYCMVRNAADADDIFQQTAITIWEKFSDFEPGTNFFTWACTIARFKFRDFVKRKARQKVYFSDEIIDKLTAEQCELGLDEARIQALAECRQKLPSGDQELLALCYRSGSRVADVAKREGCSAAKIYLHLRRIRRVLLHCIDRNVAHEGFA
jgi:RNA polymerase sigma-70 factor (ECF subfamily)